MRREGGHAERVKRVCRWFRLGSMPGVRPLWFSELLVRRRNLFALLALLAGSLAGVRPLVAQTNVVAAAPAIGEGWPTYGGDPGGLRFSTAAQITRGNVGKLHAVWSFHTHAVDSEASRRQQPSFESTPVLAGDTLYFTSPFDVVFALDAGTGVERWHYRSETQFRRPLRNCHLAWRGTMACGSGGNPRGIAMQRARFRGHARCSTDCAGRQDGETLLRDSATTAQSTCRDGVRLSRIDYYGMTSPPTVIGNVVVAGSIVPDNRRVDIESGLVRGYDAVSGKLLWSWEPLPWAAKQATRTGAGNTWSVISADPSLGLVYLPTGSASPDSYGGMRPGEDRDANSIVALDAATGRKAWAFQVVHHDVWDYDIPSEPVLFTWRGATPAVAVTTKMGMIFLLDRRTGQPLVPVEERPVPQSDVRGEQTSPTQPFQHIPPLAALAMDVRGSPSYQRSSADAEVCRKQLASLRYEGIYTPPSLKGTLYFPSNVGGVNWGGAAIDPNTGILYANTNRIASVVRLVPRYSAEHIRKQAWLTGAHYVAPYLPYLCRVRVWLAMVVLFFTLAAARRRSLNPGWSPVVVVIVGVCFVGFFHLYIGPSRLPPLQDNFAHDQAPQSETPYLLERNPLVDNQGLNCAAAPWGGITAVNLNTLTKLWEKPLGTMVPGLQTGIRNFGGPIVTASGLVITAAAEDPWLRVFDAATGEELQKLPVPIPATATPMTYSLNGRQYIVVAAGGHGDATVSLGDELIAFAVK